MYTTEKEKLKYAVGLNEIFNNYDAFIIDMWGVVFDGFSPYPGAVDCLNHMIKSGRAIIFMSNAPRPAQLTVEKLLSFNIQATPEMMLTSGDVVRKHLQETNNTNTIHREKYYHLGAHRNQDILSEITIDLVNDIKEADKILLTAYVDEDEDLNQYDNLLQEAAMNNLTAICANPDKIVINGNKNRYCAGTFAEKYEKMGGKVHYYGKPYSEIYKIAFQKLQALGIHNKNRILMIGDTLETDIAGAKMAGIESALVLSGNTSILLQGNTSNLALIENLVEKHDIHPTWILEGLKW